MKKYEYHLGIDISKKTLDICAIKNQEILFNLKIPNELKGFKILAKTLKEHKIKAKKILFCQENTGIYGTKMIAWSVKHGYPIWVENAIAIKKSLGLVRGKTDRIDAHRIALYAMRFEDLCKLFSPPREVTTTLKSLLTMRNRLVETKKRLSTPLKDSKSFLSEKDQKKFENHFKYALEGVKKSLKSLEKEINQHVKNDKKLSHMIEIISSVDGVGPQTAMALTVATNEFQNVKSSRSLSCYIGLAPFAHSSGTSVLRKSRVSPFANKSLKSLMHMGALSAIKNSGEFRSYYDRKVAEGKPKLSVINAIKNKQILRICACIRDNRMYQKTKIKSFA